MGLNLIAEIFRGWVYFRLFFISRSKFLLSFLQTAISDHDHQSVRQRDRDGKQGTGARPFASNITAHTTGVGNNNRGSRSARQDSLVNLPNNASTAQARVDAMGLTSKKPDSARMTRRGQKSGLTIVNTMKRVNEHSNNVDAVAEGVKNIKVDNTQPSVEKFATNNAQRSDRKPTHEDGKKRGKTDNYRCRKETSEPMSGSAVDDEKDPITTGPIRQAYPAVGCGISKEALLRSKRYDIDETDDCPTCLKLSILCFVSNHPGIFFILNYWAVSVLATAFSKCKVARTFVDLPQGFLF